MPSSGGTKRKNGGDDRARAGRKAEDIAVTAWTVESQLTTACIEGRGPAHECDGSCCLHGVYVSFEERDRILEYADRIREVMDESQTTEVSAWFEKKTHADDDFPGGRCIGTDVHNGKCVFLNAEGLCSLQLLEAELGLPEGIRLKPFYCRLFPLTTWGKRVEFDDMCDGVRPCCTLVWDAGLRAIDAYEYEFSEILGVDGYAELKRKVAPASEAARGER